ncbi:hypothetical protein QMP26_19520 [Enterocloster clostridioformis]
MSSIIANYVLSNKTNYIQFAIPFGGTVAHLGENDMQCGNSFEGIASYDDKKDNMMVRYDNEWDKR